MDSIKISKSSSTSSTNNSSSPSANKPITAVSSTQTTMPITVRFNAGDENIDDIFHTFHITGTTGTSSTNTGSDGGGDSSSFVSSNTNNTNTNAGVGVGDNIIPSSPLQQYQHSINNPEELNTRNNFLQGNFFNRKRSGSIEGISPTSVGPNLIAALSSSDATSMGTWRMIKGKVSQTIEDIKSSKGSATNITALQPQSYPTITIKGEEQLQQRQTMNIEFDSDQETKTSLSEQVFVESDRRSSSAGSRKQKRSGKMEWSDSELESELVLDDFEHSNFRLGFAHLKPKAKAKPAAQQALKVTLNTTPTTIASAHCSPSTLSAVRKDISPSKITTVPSSASSSLRGNFLKRRRNKGVETAELASPTNMASALAATVAASGEMAATVPVVVSGKSAKKLKNIAVNKKDIEIESGVEMLEGMIPPPVSIHLTNKASPEYVLPKRDELGLPLQTDKTNIPSYNSYTLKSIKMLYEYKDTKNCTSDETRLTSGNVDKTPHSYWDYCHKVLKLVKYLPTISVIGLILIFILPINAFIRGVLTCLLSITIFEVVWNFIQHFIERYLIHFKPEKTMFHIPDYSKMTICEVPAVKEYQTVKTYRGWMNEINSYDPITFSINRTRSIYVKLEGTILHISNTNARIPKRSLWNEQPIDHKSIVFTSHRIYDLVGCRIELLPVGLARKRHFNRKYPIQLIIKDCKVEEEKIVNIKQMKFKSARNRNKHEKKQTHELSENDSKLLDSESQNQDAPGEMDFGATILNADLQKLQDDVNPDNDLNNITIPCGDEVRLLLFARNDREKEDWFRRFVAAKNGNVHEQDLNLVKVKLINSSDLQLAATKSVQLITDPKPNQPETSRRSSKSSVCDLKQESNSTTQVEDLPDLSPAASEKEEPERDNESIDFMPNDPETIQGLLMLASAARNDPNYIKFMSLFQNACSQTKIPVYKGEIFDDPLNKKSNKRTIRLENELWKGIDQSLFLGPSGSVVWANVLAGRLLYSVLENPEIIQKIQYILQKKLNSIRLPGFVEDVVIKNIDLGNTPPLIHRVSQPLLDERGVWLDMDVTYEGHSHITVTTKLNLLRLRRPMRHTLYADSSLEIGGQGLNIAAGKDEPSSTSKAARGVAFSENLLQNALSTSVIFDSDAESQGSSSTESDSPIAGTMADNPNTVGEGHTNPGNARRIFKFVDRIATSNFFQSATELTFVQRAMENMNTNITLGLDLRGLVSRVTINIPPPPSDRIWLAFRAPPRLWLTARPTVGDKSVDWSIVTNIIEGKLCEAVNKYLVYPNMVDFTAPFMGKSPTSFI